MNVREPARIVTSTPRSTHVPPRTTSTPDATIAGSALTVAHDAGASRAIRASTVTATGASAAIAPWRIVASAKACPRPLARQMGADIDRQHEGHQHHPERKRERQVALARFERDGRRHHARDAVDVAADDD